MIYGLFLTLYVIVCALLILVVLLQSSKGGGLAGAFGGAGATGQNFFGGRGAATVLTKATKWLGTAFLGISLLLALLASRQSGPTSVLDDVSVPGTSVPSVNAPAPTQDLLNEGSIPAVATDGNAAEDGGAAPAEGQPASEPASDDDSDN